MPSIVQRVRESWACSQAKREHIRKYPQCAVCGCQRTFLRISLEAHHVVPVHVDPGLAADPHNLITLCKTHHLYVGHLGNYHAWNSNLYATINAIRQAVSTTAKRELR